MENVINAAVNGIDKLLTVVNSTRKLLFLACLVSLGGASFFCYQLVRSQAIVDEILSPKIERVGGRWCYQQRIKIRGGLNNSRLVGIQFPLNDALVAKGIEQNFSGFVLNKDISAEEFNQLCDTLVHEILKPDRQRLLLHAYPESKQELLEYYKKLDIELNRQAATKPVEKS